MKKLAFLLAFLMLFLASCSNTDNADRIKELLTSPFEYRVQTSEFVFDYKKEPEKATVTVVSPETLEGLTLEKTENGITASYDGLVVSLPESAARKIFMLDDIAEAVLKSINEKTYEITSENSNTKLTFENGYVYTVGYDCENKRLTSAEAAKDGEKHIFTFIDK